MSSMKCHPLAIWLWLNSPDIAVYTGLWLGPVLGPIVEEVLAMEFYQGLSVTFFNKLLTIFLKPYCFSQLSFMHIAQEVS